MTAGVGGFEGFVGFDELLLLFGVTGVTGMTGAGVMHSFPFQTSPVLQTIQVTPLK